MVHSPIPPEHDSFIRFSYAAADAQRVTAIARQMLTDGFRCRLPHEQNASDGVTQCGYCFVFLSETYLSDHRCLEELNLARRLEKPLLLLYLDDVELPRGMTMRIGRNQAIFCSRYLTQGELMTKIYQAQNIESFSRSGTQLSQAKGNIRRKKGFSRPILLAAALVLVIAAVGAWFFRTKPADSGVLSNNDLLEITVQNLTVEGSEVTMELSITNHAKAPMVLSPQDGYINGMGCPSLRICILEARQTTTALLTWDTTQWADLGIPVDTVTAVECTLTARYFDNTEALDPIPLVWTAEGTDNVGAAHYTPAPDVNILWDTDELCVIATESHRDTDGDWVQELVLVNRSHKGVVFALQNETINGYALPSDHEAWVNAQCMVLTQLRFPADRWQHFGYSDVLAYTGELTTTANPNRTYDFDLYPQGEAAAAALTPRDIAPDEIVFENDVIRVAYLGTDEHHQDLFHMVNLTQQTQEVTVRVEVLPNRNSYTDLVTLFPGSQTILACNTPAAPADEPNAELFFETMNQQFGQREWSRAVTVKLESIP